MLVEGIRSNASGSALTRLNLSGNSVGSKTVQSLAAILGGGDSGSFGEGMSAPELSSLDLSCNDLDAKDVECLELSLSNNRSLKSLDLRGNDYIGPEGNAAIESIAELLKATELASR